MNYTRPKTQALLFEKHRPGASAHALMPSQDQTPMDSLLPGVPLREKTGLPELSEIDVVRHYTALARLNQGVDGIFYPLGSCTMKYNPKVNEDAAAMFENIHPLLPEGMAQGCLDIMWQLTRDLCEITGMDDVCLQGAAGAHGELLGLMLIKAYHEDRGEERDEIIVPDSAHGTNPASANMAGFKVVSVACDPQGRVDLDALKGVVNERTAGLMLTNPSTLGLFETDIEAIADIVHQAGGLLYYDGANLNAIMGISRPGDMGFDVVHLNLHKTFATPHGGGGPGSGPVGVKAALAEFLPVPRVIKGGDGFAFEYGQPKSVGKIKGFYGNFLVYVKALCYIRSLGPEGLKQASEHALLNANYLMRRLAPHYMLAVAERCMHEFVLSASELPNDIHATDVAKALIDAGFHPPTVYFPLIVPEALMIEPTETETKATLDAFADAMIDIAQRAKNDPDSLKAAPETTCISRPDETRAARKNILICRMEQDHA